mmetsp:Transcript_24034/g.52629  ORF Transcript_24034/g.52629 Transcript_24034/m.52629 type:complete len:233 (+) Transcript_24034:311-1009(+)
MGSAYREGGRGPHGLAKPCGSEKETKTNVEKAKGQTDAPPECLQHVLSESTRTNRGRQFGGRNRRRNRGKRNETFAIQNPWTQKASGSKKPRTDQFWRPGADDRRQVEGHRSCHEGDLQQVCRKGKDSVQEGSHDLEREEGERTRCDDVHVETRQWPSHQQHESQRFHEIVPGIVGCVSIGFPNEFLQSNGFDEFCNPLQQSNGPRGSHATATRYFAPADGLCGQHTPFPNR